MDNTTWDLSKPERGYFALKGLCMQGDCCDDEGNFLNGTVCRQASECAAESRCNGIDAGCPASYLNGTVCRQASGCLAEGRCNGLNAECPTSSILTGKVCRQASSCVRESRCDGVNPLCPASNLQNRHPCPWRPSNNWRKRGYRIYSMKNNTGQAQAAHHREWRECEGVCFDGGCALRWDSPSCCIIADPDSRQDDYERPDDSYDHQFRNEGDQDTAPYAADVPKVGVSSYYGSADYEAGDLYCRK